MHVECDFRVRGAVRCVEGESRAFGESLEVMSGKSSVSSDVLCWLCVDCVWCVVSCRCKVNMWNVGRGHAVT